MSANGNLNPVWFEIVHLTSRVHRAPLAQKPTWPHDKLIGSRMAKEANWKWNPNPNLQWQSVALFQDQ